PSPALHQAYRNRRTEAKGQCALFQTDKLAREFARALSRFVVHLLIGAGAHLFEALRIEPGAVHALRAEMVVRLEPRRVVEARHRQVHIFASVAEFESQRGTAFTAERANGNRRAFIPVRLMAPANLSLLHIGEGHRDAAAGLLAHAAMAEIGFVTVD